MAGLAADRQTTAVRSIVLSVLLTGIVLVGLATIESSTAAFTATSSNAGSSFSSGYWRLQALASGNTHSCAALQTGLTKCWGKNDKGQLGDDTTATPAAPVTVVGSDGTGTLSDVDAVAAGKEFTCGAKSDGSVWCWGQNDRGQLGGNPAGASTRPVQVLGAGGVGVLTGVQSISSGEKHTCAAKSDGTVWCWGENSKGKLGDGSTIDSSTPVQVVGVGGAGVLSGIQSVGVGLSHSCAVASGGAVYCWGDNGEGQLGDNTTADSSVPVQVVGPGVVGTFAGGQQVAGGEKHTCVSNGDGTAWCWGKNDKGQLGDNTTTDSESPVQVTDNPGTGSLQKVAGVAAGRNKTCAYLSTFGAWCWGENKDGALGDGTTVNRSSPVQVLGPGGIGTLGDVRQLSSGMKDVSFSCAVKTNDSVWCWGKNQDGALGDGTTTNSLYPVQALT